MSCDSSGCHLSNGGNVKKHTIKVQMFSDYMCAWCYLADTMLSTLKDRFDFEVEHIGFELHEGTPEEGEDMNIHHPGTPQTIAYINQLGEPYGLHLCDLPVLANTKKALIIGEYAKEIGKGDAYVHAMWKAYMVDGRNISLLPEIEDTTKGVGIKPHEIREALQNSKYHESLQSNMDAGWSYGVNSVPTFIIDEEYKVSGSQKPEVFQKIFEEILARKQAE